MSIQISGLSKIYGTQKAVNDISFSVDSGEIVGFLGPNGAGKSTTMKMITCYVPPTEGSVVVCGENVTENSLQVRQNIGYLPEHNPLYTDMYVREYLEFVARVHHLGKIKNQRIDEIIEQTGLIPEKHKKIGQLSKGYRQRVGLAQAMLHDPKVLILDEPTSGLDPNQLADIRSLIKNLGKEKTVLLSTHILQEVEAICDRIIIIKEGKIVANDTTNNIRNQASGSSVYTVEFAENVDILSLKETLNVSNIKKTGKMWRISSNEAEDLRPQIFKIAVTNNWTLLTLTKEESTLEDIFKELTK